MSEQDAKFDSGITVSKDGVAIEGVGALAFVAEKSMSEADFRAKVTHVDMAHHHPMQVKFILATICV